MTPARRVFALCGAFLLVGLTACTTTRAPSQSWPPPSQPGEGGGVTYPSWPPPEPQPQPGASLPQPTPQAPAQQFPRTAAEVSGPAVIALIRQAQKEREAGNGEVAAATLDRARRIEPRNPFVWMELAKTQLAMDLAADAEATAERARAHARGNPYIEFELWELIAQARAQQGNASGASSARAKADELARGLPPS